MTPFNKFAGACAALVTLGLALLMQALGGLPTMLMPASAPVKTNALVTIPFAWSAAGLSNVNYIVGWSTNANWVAGYSLQFGTNAGPFAWFTNRGTATDVAITVTNGRSYTFAVAAQDSRGNMGAWSAAVTWPWPTVLMISNALLVADAPGGPWSLAVAGPVLWVTNPPGVDRFYRGRVGIAVTNLVGTFAIPQPVSTNL